MWLLFNIYSFNVQYIFLSLDELNPEKFVIYNIWYVLRFSGTFCSQWLFTPVRELDKTLFNKTFVHFILKLNVIIQFLEQKYFWYIMKTRALPPSVFWKNSFQKKSLFWYVEVGVFMPTTPSWLKTKLSVSKRYKMYRRYVTCKR